MNYEAPESIESAVALLVNSGNETKIFAGGTDLIVQMKEDRIEPTTLIDIKKIKQARDINITSDAFIFSFIGVICFFKLAMRMS